jgi:hypothetical protein
MVVDAPLGALGQNMGFVYGVDGAFLFRLDRTGFLSLRAGLEFSEYGSESKRVPLSPTIGGRILVKVSTRSIDRGVQYLGGGRASYLRPGSIVDLDNSQIQINRFERATHIILMRAGVRIGR